MIGAVECRDFWRNVLFDYPQRRKRLVRQWLYESMQCRSIAEHLQTFLETLLYSNFSFEVHHDHCRLIGGFRIPYSWLTNEERAFLIQCFEQKSSLWNKISQGQNGEFSFTSFAYNAQLQKYDNSDIVDKTWQRIMARDLCWLLVDSRYIDLFIAVQSLVVSHTDLFLVALNDAIQTDSLDQLPCWGYSFYEKHPEEEFQKTK